MENKKSFLHARCEEPIMTSNWGLPLLLALVVLGLVYAFLYLPAMAQHALLEQALLNNDTITTTPLTPPPPPTPGSEDWE